MTSMTMRLPASSTRGDYNAIITSLLHQHVTCTEKEDECHILGAQYILDHVVVELMLNVLRCHLTY